MKPQLALRKIHYWISIAALLPALIIIVTGLLLHFKKQFAWIQPPENRVMNATPALSLPEILDICRSIPELSVSTWADIDRLDVRPARGIIKVIANNRWEAQIDAATGKAIQTAYRRSDFLEALHDGSWFHDSVQLFIFVPAGIILLVLALTGLYLFALPLIRRYRNHHRWPSEFK
jgi:uncharacterized iron-regulated membrane protein